jgi:hypothetical protein
MNDDTSHPFRLKRLGRVVLGSLILAGAVPAMPAFALAQKTEQLYLSGKGPKDAVPWEFTVTGGRRANERATIPVPSVWEQHGFGTYNYGDDKSPHANEHGLYRLKFTIPADWKGARIRLVFDGVMTDATVTVNGAQVGPTHQGAFYRFHYDVTKKVRPGAENILEVDVAKESTNHDMNLAERYADYWVFGGIFRPVWLEATPLEAIDHAAIDAKADGTITADVDLAAPRTATRVEAQVTTLAGAPVGQPFSQPIPAGGGGSLRLSSRIAAPKLWSAETPNLYALKLTLYKGDEILHTTTERFGFRTFEVRPGKGLFVNGQRVLMKGVNRHSFRPETGRALDPEANYEDVRLIKSMNMNAVRLSHYSPDKAFLEAADELGLYVLDELTSWQHGQDTFVGRQLVRELVERDVNHPSIVFWDNGNEGGWNRELDGEFARYDPQKRRVMHPWELHDDVDTKHYPGYADLAKRLAGKHVVMPTEILHALYDGGGGAGLDDYWKAISASPVGGGAFIWALADEGIVRTDRNAAIDVFGTYAPDGVVGPHGEQEGSFHAIRDIWSPVQIDAPTIRPGFDGTLNVHNAYDFTSLERVRFNWSLVRFPRPDANTTVAAVVASGAARSPEVAAHASGTLKLALPRDFTKSLANADALTLTAAGPSGEALWTWTWPVAAAVLPAPLVGMPPTVSANAQEIRLSAGTVTASFDPQTGLLRGFARGARSAGVSAGPRLVFARPSKLPIPDPYGKLSSAGTPDKPFDLAWTPLEPRPEAQWLKTTQMANVARLTFDFLKTDSYARFKIEATADGKRWDTMFDGTRRGIDGDRFTFPPQAVAAIRVSQPVSDAGRQVRIKSLALGFEEGRFPGAPPRARIMTGSAGEQAWIEAEGAGGLDRTRWTMRRDGSLKLDYSYRLSGDYIYHGVTFDQPQDKLISMMRLADGPSRVWQNRLRGTGLMVTETPNHVDGPEAYGYPEFQGYFANLRWVKFNAAAGPLVVTSGAPNVYLRVGTPRLSHGSTSADFPAGDLSFLAAIPAIGSKVIPAEYSGPSSLPANANGTYTGSLLFTLPEK